MLGSGSVAGGDERVDQVVGKRVQRHRALLPRAPLAVGAAQRLTVAVRAAASSSPITTANSAPLASARLNWALKPPPPACITTSRPALRSDSDTVNATVRAASPWWTT